MNIFRKIPGFRSGKWWKILIASGFYLFGFLTILAIVNPPAPTLALDKINPTNKSSVSIGGKTYSGKEVYLLENNQEIQSVKADSQGKFYFPINDLKDGNYAYAVQVCHSEKKDRCNTENILVIVDQTPPAKPAIALPTNLPDDSEEKITRNIRRDKEVNRQLKKQGWLIMRLWTKDLIKNPSHAKMLLSNKFKNL